MNQARQQSSLPVVVTLVAAGLPMVMGDTGHMCHLRSFIVEIPLLVGVVLACCLWTVCAKTSGQAWLRTGLAFVLAIAIEMTYLTWLHSNYFPQALLSSKAKQREAELDELELDELRKSRLPQHSPGGDALKAARQD